MTADEYCRLLASQWPECARYAGRLLGDRDAGDDVIARVARDVQDKLRGIHPDHVRGYLWRSVRNRCLDTLRIAKYRTRLISRHEGDVAEWWGERDPHREMEEREDAAAVQSQLAAIHRAMSRLPGAYRELMLRHYVHGQHAGLIASEMHMTGAAVRMGLTRARRALRAEIGIAA